MISMTETRALRISGVSALKAATAVEEGFIFRSVARFQQHGFGLGRIPAAARRWVEDTRPPNRPVPARL